jgi:ElaB/YqjD/DUF883 family membrane-anchored ribosome-binding protein
MDDARSRAGDLGDEVKEQATDAMIRTRDEARRIAHATEANVEAHPFMFGALAALAGVGVGMLLSRR